MPTPKSTSFLPKDYTVKTGGSDFYKLAQGDNKFRIVSAPIVGTEGWKDNKPFRRSSDPISPDEVDVDQKSGKPKINEYMAMYVYDYLTKSVMIASFTQATIKKAILDYSNDADWGHPSGYDFVVNKTGEGFSTKYTVKTSVPKALDAAAQKVVAVAEPTFDLDGALSVDKDD